MQNYQIICSQLLTTLPEKPREIIKRRFGLPENQEPQTLREIGVFLDLTRERIRQIESESLRKLSKQAISQKQIQDLSDYFKKYLQKSGGFKREDLLLGELAPKDSQNYLLLILTVSPGIFRFSANKDFHCFWTNDKKAIQNISPLLAKLAGFFNNLKNPVSKSAIYNLFAKRPRAFVDSLLEVSMLVDIGPLGEVGLTAWREIKPKSARDAAYLILKKAKKPLHFQDIAKLSRAMDGEFFQRKKVLPQTVHNELIKDPQFILVGRGVYSLREWGYREGTVKDVIVGLLKNSKDPLSREQILKQVAEQRMVQPNTIFLNLADKQKFIRDNQGRYTLKEI